MTGPGRRSRPPPVLPPSLQALDASFDHQFFFLKCCSNFLYRIVCQALTLHTQRGLAGLQMVAWWGSSSSSRPLLSDPGVAAGCCNCVVATLEGEPESEEVKSRILSLDSS